jgi:hypothetical protein
VPRAATEDEAAAPLPPGSSGDAKWYHGTLTRIGQPGNGHRGSGQQASTSASAAASAPASVSASPTTSATTSAPLSVPLPTSSAPPAEPGESPAASGTPDAILRRAHCVAGELIGGQFSSFTQVGACNAVAFFRAANVAIRAGKLRVPAPGTAVDGQECLTTRSFALIDQDQSDNVTTEYLADRNGETAQDTAADRRALHHSTVLFNGSDNGLLDLFVDPALGCRPWEVPNLADRGAPTTALPLDELQAARWAGARGNPPALVPLNDPMTVDNNGNFNTDKTNTYRSIVDMPSLPVGESPRAYCSDMEQIQGKRLQQDVNLLIHTPGPLPAAADNLFTFMAMRLQQSFMNLNCSSFGMVNDVSTTLNSKGVVVAACFRHYFGPVTTGLGNPMARLAVCPATTH